MGLSHQPFWTRNLFWKTHLCKKIKNICINQYRLWDLKWDLKNKCKKILRKMWVNEAQCFHLVFARECTQCKWNLIMVVWSKENEIHLNEIYKSHRQQWIQLTNIFGKPIQDSSCKINNTTHLAFDVYDFASKVPIHSLMTFTDRFWTEKTDT